MEDDILIDNYLKGLLVKDDQQSFLERLKSDIDFKEKFELEEQLFNSLNEESWSFAERKNTEVESYEALLEQDDLKNLKDTLIQVNSEFNLESKKNNKKLFYYLAAASIILFFGLQLVFNQGISNEDLYNDYLNLNDLPSFVTRGSTEDIGNQLIEAQKFFESRNYKESLTILEPILETTKTNASAYLYAGIAQTELGLNEIAEKTFDSLINSGLLEAESGYWYKALLFLKQDRVEEAKQLLDTIISKSLYNHKKAKLLLDEL